MAELHEQFNEHVTSLLALVQSISTEKEFQQSIKLLREKYGVLCRTHETMPLEQASSHILEYVDIIKKGQDSFEAWCMSQTIPDIQGEFNIIGNAAKILKREMSTLEAAKKKKIYATIVRIASVCVKYTFKN